jgi:hypothetical protein
MGAISDGIARFFPQLSKRPRIEKKEALEILPVRNSRIKWERKGSEILLDVPLRDDKFARFVKRLMKNMPDTRQISLDELGAGVWEMCDGKNNVNSIVSAISKNYKLTRREAEASVTMFMSTLAKKNLIALMSAGGKKSVNKDKHKTR